MVAQLKRHHVGAGAPFADEPAPTGVTVHGARGQPVLLDTPWQHGPLVLVFFRGGWSQPGDKVPGSTATAPAAGACAAARLRAGDHDVQSRHPGAAYNAIRAASRKPAPEAATFGHHCTLR